MKKCLSLTLLSICLALATYVHATPGAKLYFIEVSYLDASGQAIGGYLLNECQPNTYHPWGTSEGAVSTQTVKERCNFDHAPAN